MQTRIARPPRVEQKILPSYNGPVPMFLENAKEVIARCIQAGIIGDSSARDFFKSYSSHLTNEGGDGIDDFLSFAYRDNEEQCTQIATMLNSSLEYPLPRLDMDPWKVMTANSGVLDGELLTFCKKVKTPLLSSSTSDLLIFGVCNPYLARHLESAFASEVLDLESSYRYYILLGPKQMVAALAKMGD